MKKKALIIFLALTMVLGMAHATYASGDYMEELVYFSEESNSYITEYDESKMPAFFGNGIDATLQMDTTTIFFGNQVVIKGNYTKDVIVFGNSISIDADIEGNLYMFSSVATQNGRVGGDLFNFSASFQQAATGTVGGALYAFCSDPKLLGEVARSAYLFCDKAYISGRIGGNVQGAMDSLTLDDSAEVGGFVKYRGNNDPNLIGAAQSIHFERLPIIKAEPQTFAQRAREFVLSALGFAAATLLVFLIFFRLTPCVSERIGQNLKHRLGAVFGLGSAVLLGVPLVTILLMFVSPRAGFALLFLYVFLILISMFVSLVFLFDLVTAGKENITFVLRMLFVALMGFGMKVLFTVPVLGWVLGLAGTIFGIGLLMSLLLRPARQQPVGNLAVPDQSSRE